MQSIFKLLPLKWVRGLFPNEDMFVNCGELAQYRSSVEFESITNYQSFSLFSKWCTLGSVFSLCAFKLIFCLICTAMFKIGWIQRTVQFTSIEQPRRQLLRRPRSPVARYLEKLAEEQEMQAANWSDEQSSDNVPKDQAQQKSEDMSVNWRK